MKLLRAALPIVSIVGFIYFTIFSGHPWYLRIILGALCFPGLALVGSLLLSGRPRR